MHTRKLGPKLMIGALAITAGLSNAQTFQRKAVFVGGGNQGQGKCTVEVQVDASAQVEVRGDTAILRNTGGQSPQWRRFECTSPMPANPPNFRFAGVDGRGSQALARDPRNSGGAAVVDIEDPQGGAEAYTFDLFWGEPSAVSGGFQPQRGPEPFNNGPAGRGDRGFQDQPGFGPPNNRPGDPYGFRRNPRMTQDEAFQVCRQSVRDQAAGRFATQNIDIRNIAIDNNPGRNDWIVGDLAVRRRFGRQETYRFSCSVNFDTGQVRSTHIDQFEQRSYQNGR
jgi:hypothetical protein